MSANTCSQSQPPLGAPAWTPPEKQLSELRIALITTARLHFRDDPAFEFTDATFRPISGDENADNLIMSHRSVNFDRSGFAEDVNLVFPMSRFRELEAEGGIDSLADVHYSFMGAGLKPEAYEATASQVAGLLKQDKVDTVFLNPA